MLQWLSFQQQDLLKLWKDLIISPNRLFVNTKMYKSPISYQSYLLHNRQIPVRSNNLENIITRQHIQSTFKIQSTFNTDKQVRVWTTWRGQKLWKRLLILTVHQQLFSNTKWDPRLEQHKQWLKWIVIQWLEIVWANGAVCSLPNSTTSTLWYFCKQLLRNKYETNHPQRLRHYHQIMDWIFEEKDRTTQSRTPWRILLCQHRGSCSQRGPGLVLDRSLRHC